jgi:hypothetical protein
MPWTREQLIEEAEHRRERAQSSADDREGSGDSWPYQEEADFYSGILDVLRRERVRV